MNGNAPRACVKPRARLLNAFVLVSAALVFCSLSTCPRHARAQDLDDVSFGGVVTDQHGAVVPGAAVTARLAGAKAVRTTLTDGRGRYRLVELAPGVYTLSVTRAGFAAEERREVRTLSGESVRLDFTLRPEGVAAEQTVLSEADAPALDVTRTVTGGSLTREELERLPSGSRSPLDFVLLLGGVTEEPLSTRDAAEDRDDSRRAGVRRAAEAPEEAGTFALAGGAAYSNNITVDGLDNNDDRAARERFQPPSAAVEEVQVVTNQFSAEYGRASGGRVNLRTRSGSNSLRGRFSYFFKDESLNANTWSNNRRGLKRLPLQEHRPGFTLGGPVRVPARLFGPAAYDGRGRTFFFFAYERDYLLDSTLVDALVPVEQNPSFPLPRPTTLAGRRFEREATPPNAAAELAPFVERVSTPLDSTALTARLDHAYTHAHNGTFLLQLGRSRNLRQFGGGLRLAESLQGRRRDTDAVAYTDNLVISARAVNQLRAQVSRLRPSLRAAGTRPVVLVDIDDPLGASSEAADRSGTLVAGSSTSGATDRAETRLQLQETLTLVRGAHTFKLGADVQRVRSTFVDLTDATGTYSFASAGDFLAGTPSRFRQRFNTESAQKNTYAGLFIQGEWRPHGRITLTAGLRYERESVMRDADNFGPRLGLAFDLTGSGRTVVRAGAGVFYNRALLRTLDDFTLGRAAVEFDTDDLPPSERRDVLAARLRFPSTPDADSPLVREFGARATDFSRRLDPRLRVPESYQMNFGFERELGRGFVVEANYTFNRGIHLWREFNANAPRLPAGFDDFTAYLLSRDFPNFRDPAGARPVYGASAAGELVRFTLAPPDADNITRVVEFGVPVSVFNLNGVGSSTTLGAALAALQPLRPDPTRVQVEQLASVGNSFYHGLVVEARRRFKLSGTGAGGSLRAAYTLSRLIDDGVVNTSSALRVGDFRAERARSLLDRRHRFVLAATLDAPRRLGRLRFAPVLRLASGAPFNVTLGGDDRNLDDVGNDRPAFAGDPRLIRWREPGEPPDPRLLEAFALPAVGQTGDLPRNAGRGPALFAFDLSVEREFRLSERARLRPSVEVENVLNKTVYTFGAEFINFDALRPGATAEQRRAFADTFLVPTRTLRPRTVRVGLRLDF
jgi:hypothetical protein